MLSIWSVVCDALRGIIGGREDEPWRTVEVCSSFYLSSIFSKTNLVHE